MKEKTCFTSLIAFYDEMTMVDEGRAVSVIYYDLMGGCQKSPIAYS